MVPWVLRFRTSPASVSVPAGCRPQRPLPLWAAAATHHGRVLGRSFSGPLHGEKLIYTPSFITRCPISAIYERGSPIGLARHDANGVINAGAAAGRRGGATPAGPAGATAGSHGAAPRTEIPRTSAAPEPATVARPSGICHMGTW